MEWTPEAEKAMEGVPFFVRGMAKKSVEKAAAAEGTTVIDLALVQRVREQRSKG